jgi:hypothetical protein
VGSVAVEDMPLAAVKFYGEIIMVPDRDPVGKHVLPRNRIAVVGLVKSLDVNFNPFRDFVCHGVNLYKIREKG